MLRFSAFLYLFLVVAATGLSQPEYSLTEADRALGAKEYNVAASILDSLERQGPVSADFYLALGNARFQSGQIGRAILAYERGLRLKPGRKDLKNNLRYVREEAGITAPALPDFFLLRWWRLLGAALGTTTAYVLSILFWWIAVAGAVWWYLRREGMEEKRRFALLPTAFVCVVLAVLFYALGSSRQAFLNKQDEAVLTATDATLRVSPTPDGSVEAELEEGHKLYITDRVGGYVKVTLVDGQSGYLPVEVLEVI